MDTTIGTSNSSSLHNNANPPSIELAYKKKCIQLKKRLNEIETENDSMRARNKRAKSYIQKMRLETCIMLERLATLTGMLDEQQQQQQSSAGGDAGGAGKGMVNAELRARAAAVLGDARAAAAAVEQDVLDDETEGSSEERPPTPQDRPLRVKRSRRSNMPIDELEAEAAMQFEAASPEKSYTNNNIHSNGSNNNHAAAAESELASSGLPALAPAPASAQRRQSQQDQPTTSGFRAVNNGGAGSIRSNNVNNPSSSAADGGSPPADEPVPMDVDERVAKSES